MARSSNSIRQHFESAAEALVGTYNRRVARPLGRSPRTRCRAEDIRTTRTASVRPRTRKSIEGQISWVLPTEPKPPPQREVEDLLMGLFGWLRDQGFTTARVPARAKREIHAALSARRLTGSAETVGAGFLVALDTWFHLAAPELRRRAERSATRGNSNALVPSEDDAKRRDEAIGLLRSLSLERLSDLVQGIVTVDVERAGPQRSAKPSVCSTLGSRWATLRAPRFEVARTNQKNQRRETGAKPVVRPEGSRDTRAAEVQPRKSNRP